MTSQEQAMALYENIGAKYKFCGCKECEEGKTQDLVIIAQALDAARRDQLVSDIRAARALPVSHVLVHQLEAELAARDNPALVIRQPKNPMQIEALDAARRETWEEAAKVMEEECSLDWLAITRITNFFKQQATAQADKEA